MGRLEELRLITKVATLYYRHGLRQAEIAERLDLSQASVSRLLKRGESEGIVRITVAAPKGASQVGRMRKRRPSLNCGCSCASCAMIDVASAWA